MDFTNIFLSRYRQTIFCILTSERLISFQRGESFNESDVNGCEVEYICTSDRLGTGCFKSKINSDPRGRCSSREEYKKSCNKNEIVIKVNSTDPCCENYTCGETMPCFDILNDSLELINYYHFNSDKITRPETIIPM